MKFLKQLPLLSLFLTAPSTFSSDIQISDGFFISGFGKIPLNPEKKIGKEKEEEKESVIDRLKKVDYNKSAMGVSMGIDSVSLSGIFSMIKFSAMMERPGQSLFFHNAQKEEKKEEIKKLVAIKTSYDLEIGLSLGYCIRNLFAPYAHLGYGWGRVAVSEQKEANKGTVDFSEIKQGKGWLRGPVIGLGAQFFLGDHVIIGASYDRYLPGKLSLKHLVDTNSLEKSGLDSNELRGNESQNFATVYLGWRF